MDQFATRNDVLINEEPRGVVYYELLLSGTKKCVKLNLPPIVGKIGLKVLQQPQEEERFNVEFAGLKLIDFEVMVTKRIRALCEIRKEHTVFADDEIRIPENVI